MEPWHYDTPPDLDRPLLERLCRFPREPNLLVCGLRRLTATMLRGWLRVFHRLTIVGRENLPADSSFVMVANHASHLDTLCLLAALPMARLHRAFPAAARDYFFVNSMRAFLSAVVANALPFDRKLDPRHSLELCTQLLANPGNILIVFPEGTRSDTGALYGFKPGVGLVVAGSDVPVVPCYLDGTHAAWPKSASLPRPRSIRLTIGTPRRYAQFTRDKQSAIQICSDLRDAVQMLAAPSREPALALAQ